MKLLYVLPRIPLPANDGAAIGMLEPLQQLARRGHRVTVAALNPRKHEQRPELLQQAVPGTTVHAVLADTAPSWRQAFWNLLFGRVPYQFRRFLHEDFSRLLAQLLRAERYDAILIESAYLLPYLDVLRHHAKGTPLLVRLPAVEHTVWARTASMEHDPLRRTYYRMAARWGRRYEAQQLQRVDGIICLSDEDAAELLALGVARTPDVVPPAVPMLAPPDKLPPVLDEAIAYLGALDWAPNLQGMQWFLDHVWPTLRAERPKLTLHIAGKNPAATAYEWATAPGVHFYGEVPDAASFLLQFEVVIVPMLAGSGVRLKVVQALQLGRALVATPAAVHGLDLLHEEHLLLADSESSFADAVLRLLDASGLRSALGAAGRNWVLQHCAPQGIGARLEAVLLRHTAPEPAP